MGSDSGLLRQYLPPRAGLASGIQVGVVLETGDDPLPLRSAVRLDSVAGVSVTTLVERLGRLSEERIRQVCAELAIAVACDP